MGRFHWVTIVNPASLPAGYLAELLDWSYRKAVSGLTRKQRAALAPHP